MELLAFYPKYYNGLESCPNVTRTMFLCSSSLVLCYRGQHYGEKISGATELIHRDDLRTTGSSSVALLRHRNLQPISASLYLLEIACTVHSVLKVNVEVILGRVLYSGNAEARTQTFEGSTAATSPNLILLSIFQGRLSSTIGAYQSLSPILHKIKVKIF